MDVPDEGRVVLVERRDQDGAPDTTPKREGDLDLLEDAAVGLGPRHGRDLTQVDAGRELRVAAGPALPVAILRKGGSAVCSTPPEVSSASVDAPRLDRPRRLV
jgi:hypothetical protein